MVDNHVAIRMLLILAATIILFAIVAFYTNKKSGVQGFKQQKRRGGRERFDDWGAAGGSDSLAPPGGAGSGAGPRASQSSFGPTDPAAPYPASVRSSDSLAEDQMRLQQRANAAAAASAAGSAGYAERISSVGGCFPKDELNPEDLLPKDSADSRWARMNPSGQGDIRDQNFLTAGYNIGIDTQSSSLRNANLQIRSEPANPQVAVSPWMTSTITPDMNRRPLEIGGDY